ncbi:MAG: FAD-binding oxidoreductase [Ktedonobacterales bacterium]
MSQTPERVEVLVIGGGVIGSAIAYHVARQGRSVLVVDRDAVAAEPAASWASAGGVRRQEQHPAEAALASEAIERWHTLAEELDADLQYRQGGHLLLAENEAEAEHLQTFVRSQHNVGFADVYYVDRQDVFSLAPGLGEQVVAGSFSPADGQADPVRTTRAFANAAKRHGAIYWTKTGCLALERVADRVVGARTERGNVRAEHIVLAAGAWSRELASSVGLSLPLRVRVLQALLSTPAPPDTLRPVVNALGRALSLKQLPGGEFLLGGGWLGDPTPDHRSYTLRQASQQGNWATACELFPPVSQQRLARAWGGLQAQTVDDIPFIGSVSGLEGLTLALGSWHGFGLAPAIGRSVADHLAGRPTPELDQLTPDRIASVDPAHVAAFLAEPATPSVA